MATLNYKLPLEKAWDYVMLQIDAKDDIHIGYTVHQLDEYITSIGKYALIVSVQSTKRPVVFITVKDELVKSDDQHIHRYDNVLDVNIGSKRYLGVAVQNAMQAGAVIRVLEDAYKERVNIIQAINYIADRTR